MNYLPKNLNFKEGIAYIGETSLTDVAKNYGTPLYVYDCCLLYTSPSPRDS